MISPKEIKEKAKRKFHDFLRYEIDSFFNEKEKDFFPLIIPANTGKANDDLLKRQKELQLLISESKQKAEKGYSLELETVSSRTNDEQTIVKIIFFEKREDFLWFIGETKSCEQFITALEMIHKRGILSEEKLQIWAKKHLKELTEIPKEKNYWENICICVDWLNNNQNTNLYIREIPLPVHSKFIESNERIIKSLANKADIEESFEVTFGLKEKPALVRFRSLDEAIKLPFSNSILAECTMTVKDFSLLDKSFVSQIEKVIIVENEIVFLTFPKTENAICICGHGYTVNSLETVSWFYDKKLLYFGDLDENGFDILSTFRKYYSKIENFMMNKKILEE